MVGADVWSGDCVRFAGHRLAVDGLAGRVGREIARDAAACAVEDSAAGWGDAGGACGCRNAGARGVAGGA